MAANWLLSLSDWNPQFFREVKGRLNRRNLAMTAIASLSIQVLVLLYFWVELPDCTTKASSRYFVGVEKYSRPPLCDALGNPAIDWHRWWLDIFQLLSWALPFILLIAGVYMLISDLAKEERRGTLNFIRLSPQTSQRILTGKLLGVPIVPYLAVALALPLHLIAGVNAALPVSVISSIYVLTIATCCFYYTGALLYSFLGGSQGWVGAVFVWFSYTIFFQFGMTLTDFGTGFMEWLKWYGLPIASYLGLALTFALLTLGTGTFWIWQALNRRFRNPLATLLSKKQSYMVTACVEIWMVGFVFQESDPSTRPIDYLMVLTVFNLGWFMVLIAALTPHRQMLLDWARYRRERVGGESTHRAKRRWTNPLVKDLIWGEKSPSLVAIAVNLLITAAILAPWMLTWTDGSQFRGVATLLLEATFVLICAAIAQLILLMKSSKRTLWAAVVIGGLIIVPPTVLTVLTLSSYQTPVAWLFSAFAFVAIQEASATAVFFSFLGHIAVLSLLTLRMTRQLRKAGESESKALLAGSRA